MDPTIKDAAIRAFPDFEAFKVHVLAFITSNNFAKH